MRKSQINRIIFHCDGCDYNTYNKYDFNKHLLTDKHKILTNTDEQVAQNRITYKCHCGKNYKHSQSLYNHKKKCQQTNDSIIEQKDDLKDELKDDFKLEKPNADEISTLKEMLFEMIHQNKELQKTITEMVPKIGNNNNSNNNIIVNNLTLLNTNCKDALSLNEFIESIQVGIKDLVYTSEKGLTNGVTNLFLENYNKLPLQKRPLWCSDLKRKKMYIKEADWQEDINNIKTKAAIKTLTSIQARSSGKYIQENPDWMEHDKKKERFVHIVKETTEEMDNTKQTHILINLLDNAHLTDTIKSELKTA